MAVICPHLQKYNQEVEVKEIHEGLGLKIQ